MNKEQYYKKCCEGREKDLIFYISKVFPGQTIDVNYVFKNARICDIAKSSNATQRMINWCQENLKKGASYERKEA